MNPSLHAASIFPSLVLFFECRSWGLTANKIYIFQLWPNALRTRLPGPFFSRAFIFLSLRLPFPALIFPTNFAHSNLI